MSVAAYGSFTHGRLLRRCAGGLRLFQQPAAAADHHPRPAAAHRQRQHRRQPVPGPGRDRLQASASSRRRRRRVTPFARLQASTRDPERPSPNGAPTRSASTWRSRRPTRCARRFGADLGGVDRRSATSARSTSALRLGWLHEYADTGRPMTAAFAGAPSNAFTVYGATPQRDVGGDRLLGQHARRRGDPALLPLRRRDRRRHRQPRLQRRGAAELVRRPVRPDRAPWRGRPPPRPAIAGSRSAPGPSRPRRSTLPRQRRTP